MVAQLLVYQPPRIRSRLYSIAVVDMHGARSIDGSSLSFPDPAANVSERGDRGVSQRRNAKTKGENEGGRTTEKCI